jgi:hypothetical protein
MVKLPNQDLSACWIFQGKSVEFRGKLECMSKDAQNTSPPAIITNDGGAPKIIKVTITSPAPPPASECAQYLDQANCNLHGCSWYSSHCDVAG